MAARQSDVRKAVRKAIAAGFKALQERRAKLEQRRQSLEADLAEVTAKLAGLDQELGAAVQEALREAGLRPVGPAGRARRGSNTAWVMGLLKARGPLQSGQIMDEARRAGLNTAAIASLLSSAAKAGTLKAEKARSGKGKVYSLA